MGQDYESTAQAALEAYNRTCIELASLHRERGDVRSVVLKARVSAYEDATAQGANVTGARHAADMAGEYHDAELHKIDGEIAALEVTLRYLDQLLSHIHARMESQWRSQTHE